MQCSVVIKSNGCDWTHSSVLQRKAGTSEDSMMCRCANSLSKAVMDDKVRLLYPLVPSFLSSYVDVGPGPSEAGAPEAEGSPEAG